MNLNETLTFAPVKTDSGTQRFLVRTANNYLLGEIRFDFRKYDYTFVKSDKEICVLPEKELIYAAQIERKIKELSARFQELNLKGGSRPKNRIK